MKVKKGDKVLITQGKDRGKSGTILRASPKEGKLIVEGLNLITRHVKPRKAGEKGQKIKTPSPLHVSNIKIICPKCKKASRIGYLVDKSKKSRICKKCQTILD